jgi:hypothetical protein
MCKENHLSWFIEMFTDVSDRARFFAIVISSIVAVSVVLLNQYFNRVSARRTLNIEKIESIYQSLVAFRNASYVYIHRLYTKEESTDELGILYQTAVDHIKDAEVITTLHFPNIQINSLDIHKVLMEKYNALIPSRYKGGDDWYEQTLRDIEHIKSIFNPIEKQCKNEMLKYKH